MPISNSIRLSKHRHTLKYEWAMVNVRACVHVFECVCVGLGIGLLQFHVWSLQGENYEKIIV